MQPKDFELTYFQRFTIPVRAIYRGLDFLSSPIFNRPPTLIKDCLKLTWGFIKGCASDIKGGAILSIFSHTANFIKNFGALPFKFLLNCVKDVAYGVYHIFAGIIYPVADLLDIKNELITNKVEESINRELQEKLVAFNLENLSKLPKEGQSIAEITDNAVSVKQGINGLFRDTEIHYKQQVPDAIKENIIEIVNNWHDKHLDEINKILSPIVYAQNIIVAELKFNKNKELFSDNQKLLYKLVFTTYNEICNIKIKTTKYTKCEIFDYKNNFLTARVEAMEKECLDILDRYHDKERPAKIQITGQSFKTEVSTPSAELLSPRSASSSSPSL